MPFCPVFVASHYIIGRSTFGILNASKRRKRNWKEGKAFVDWKIKATLAFLQKLASTATWVNTQQKRIQFRSLQQPFKGLTLKVNKTFCSVTNFGFLFITKRVEFLKITTFWSCNFCQVGKTFSFCRKSQSYSIDIVLAMSSL